MGNLEIKEYDKDFGAFIVVFTSECEKWAIDGSKPLIVPVTKPEDFFYAGLEVTTKGAPFTDLKVGEKTSDKGWGGKYEGIYVMRVA